MPRGRSTHQIGRVAISQPPYPVGVCGGWNSEKACGELAIPGAFSIGFWLRRDLPCGVLTLRNEARGWPDDLVESGSASFTPAGAPGPPRSI